MFTFALSDTLLAPLVILAAKTAVVVGGLTGLIAVVSPRTFGQLAALGGTWFDTRATFERLDRPVFVLTPLRNSRWFGAVILAGAGLLVFLTPAAAEWTWIGWTVAGILACVGLVALCCPSGFRRVADSLDTWVDTAPFFAAFDRYIDFDQPVVRHSRLFGSALLATATMIAAVCLV